MASSSLADNRPEQTNVRQWRGRYDRVLRLLGLPEISAAIPPGDPAELTAFDALLAVAESADDDQRQPGADAQPVNIASLANQFVPGSLQRLEAARVNLANKTRAADAALERLADTPRVAPADRPGSAVDLAGVDLSRDRPANWSFSQPVVPQPPADLTAQQIAKGTAILLGRLRFDEQ
jgi:hypothetical protein